LPTPDATGSIAMAATAGKVALVSSTTALSGACPTVGIIDFVGYGTTASCFEGSGRAPAPSNTTSDQRVGGGATDTGGPVQFVLNPDADFSSSESCTVTVVAANVTDQDTDDPPDNMTADAT